VRSADCFVDNHGTKALLIYITIYSKVITCNDGNKSNNDIQGHCCDNATPDHFCKLTVTSKNISQQCAPTMTSVPTVETMFSNNDLVPIDAKMRSNNDIRSHCYKKELQQ
jgi:hypothetical protein